MTIERTLQGLRITKLHNGYFVSKLYIGYSKAEAIRLFKQHLKGK